MHLIGAAYRWVPIDGQIWYFRNDSKHVFWTAVDRMPVPNRSREIPSFLHRPRFR